MPNVSALVEAVISQQAVAPVTMQTVALPDVLDALYATRYTGLSLVHWHEGKIKTIQIPNPVTVKVR